MFVPCVTCQLRQKPLFHQVSEAELAFIASLKSAHIAVAQKIDVVQAGEIGGSLYTLFGGWAFRYKRLPDGKRQILNFLLPGDLIGLEAALFGGVEHSVQTLTPASLCVLDGRSIQEMFRSQPDLALHLARTLVEDQRAADERIALLGHRNGPQRLGYLMLETFDRLRRRGMADGTWCPFPVQRQQLADALGLSRTHLIRSLADLQEMGLATITNHTLALHDRERLAAYSGYRAAERSGRRIIL
jgi:CRP/FNR family transcriptional regulator, anaerobic regulatory protein